MAPAIMPEVILCRIAYPYLWPVGISPQKVFSLTAYCDGITKRGDWRHFRNILFYIRRCFAPMSQSVRWGGGT